MEWTEKVVGGRVLQDSDTISVKFSVFKNFPSFTIFIIKSPNFRHLQTLTCSLHF